MGSWANISEKSFRGSSDNEDDDEKDKEDTSDESDDDAGSKNWLKFWELDANSSYWGVSSAEATVKLVALLLLSVTETLSIKILKSIKEEVRWLKPLPLYFWPLSRRVKMCIIYTCHRMCFCTLKFHKRDKPFILYCSWLPFRCPLR